MFTFVTSKIQQSLFTMINNQEFSKRLQKVIEYYGESASSFSEKIGVQRSSISHILSGRNKPSLDFVLKVLSSFPDVELYWLLNGKGQFPNQQENRIEEKQTKIAIDNIPSQPEQKIQKPISKTSSNKKEIDRIIIFYSDGTFENFNKSE
ncbi:helix-turn-helix transcriptional regulator [Corallibacter vietnamensis]|uniref:Helix-turn-helix transcriptional regulator n=2 Tax=Corallibacter vietnamensis TaxID=904130 RepID=A0ABP7HG20_9FLAO